MHTLHIMGLSVYTTFILGKNFSILSSRFYEVKNVAHFMTKLSINRLRTFYTVYSLHTSTLPLRTCKNPQEHL